MVVKQALVKHKTVKQLPKCRRGDVLCALEELVGPEVQIRAQGLEKLLALDAHRRSPLVATVLVSRVGEPDLDLRLEIVKALAMVLRPDLDGPRPLESVRRWLRYTLSQMRRRETFASDHRYLIRRPRSGVPCSGRMLLLRRSVGANSRGSQWRGRRKNRGGKAHW